MFFCNAIIFPRPIINVTCKLLITFPNYSSSTIICSLRYAWKVLTFWVASACFTTWESQHCARLRREHIECIVRNSSNVHFENNPKIFISTFSIRSWWKNCQWNGGILLKSPNSRTILNSSWSHGVCRTPDMYLPIFCKFLDLNNTV